MILLNIDKKVNQPLYQQVYEQIIEIIQKDIIQPGGKLPSTRLLAEKHGISRTSVARAYEELWLRGYTDSSQGSFTFVKSKFPSTSVSGKSEECKVDWSKRLKDCCFQIKEETINRPESSGTLNKDFIDMGWFDIDERLIPLTEFKRSINNAINEFGQKVFMYADFQGFYPLREFIATRSNKHGMLVKADELIITNGSQNALELITRLLCKSNTSVIVEKPTYLNIMPLFRNLGVEVLEAEMEDDGINVSQVENLIRDKKPAFVYTMPNFQNPTGISMSQAKREKLLEVCLNYNIPIVEDGFEEEMKYMGKLPLSIKAIDKNNIVIYVSSFSKIFSTGLRVGWIAGHDSLIEKLVALKRYSDIASSSFVQAILYEFCNCGYFDNHIKKINRIYKRRMNLALQTLDDHIELPEVSWTKPLGGYLIWFKLRNNGKSESELMKIIEKHGTNVNPGSRFEANEKNYLFFRLTISKMNEKELVNGIRRLSKALKEFYST